MWALTAGPTEAPITPDWQALLERFGLPLFMLVVVLWTGARGAWVFRGTVDRIEKAATAAASSAEARAVKAEAERDAARTDVGRLQDERLRDAQRALAGWGTRVYDATQLAEAATRVVADTAGPGNIRDELDAIRSELRAFTERAGASMGGDRSPAPEARRGPSAGTGDGSGDRSWEGT